VYSENDIPRNSSFSAFLQEVKGIRKITGFIKWIYLHLLTSIFPKNMEHIIFSPFLEKHIKNHFSEGQIYILEHTYNENIFHP
jgi:hypothetical protein